MDWKAEICLPVEDIYGQNVDVLLMLLIKQATKTAAEREECKLCHEGGHM